MVGGIRSSISGCNDGPGHRQDSDVPILLYPDISLIHLGYKLRSLDVLRFDVRYGKGR